MGHSCSKYAGADPTAVEARGGGGGVGSGPLSSGAHALSSSKRGRGNGGSTTSDCLDPFMHDLMKRSLEYATTGTCADPCPPPTTSQMPSVSSSPSSPHRNSSNSTSSRHRTKGSSGGHRQQRTSSSSHSAGTTGTSSPYGRPWMEQGQAHLLFKRNHQHHSSSSSKSYAGSGGASASSVSATSSVSQMQYTQDTTPPTTMVHYPTRLVVRRRTVRSSQEEGTSGTHIYAVRYPLDQPLKRELHAKSTQEQCPRSALPLGTPAATTTTTATTAMMPPPSASGSGPRTTNHRMVPPKHRLLLGSAAASAAATAAAAALSPPTVHSSATAQHPHQSPHAPAPPSGSASAASASSGSSESSLQHVHVDQLFVRETLLAEPKYPVIEWVTVSSEHHVYVVDTGLSALDCDDLIEITEHACKGQYAAYTYAKQTLGCREFPALAVAARDVVHSVVHAIYTKFAADHAQRLLLDDREPHVVKYDVTKKERQKLDMHTDKSEWTFLIALSNGCGLDYDGGGTYFECLDATVHVQRGQALVFPGRLRHCGQRITSGLRFLLVGFLVDKTASGKTVAGAASGGIGGALGVGTTDLDPTLLAQVANVP